jgi:hypothetical protein
MELRLDGLCRRLVMGEGEDAEDKEELYVQAVDYIAFDVSFFTLVCQ